MRKAMVSLLHFFTTTALVLIGAAPALAQSSPQPYGLDPYKPSDAYWLRNYGAVLVGETPLQELTTLDPYKPSEAALIRQLGGALPACCQGWFGTVLMPPGTPRGLRPTVTFKPGGGNNVILAVPPAASSANAAAAAPATPAAPPTPMRSAIQPEGNDGVWIQFEGQRWVSAGRAVPLASLVADRVGEYAGVAVYRARGADDVIYMPSREGMVAPFRRKP